MNSVNIEPNRPPLDLTIAVTTPENISFEYQLAGPFRRLPAFLLDVAFRWLVVLVIFFVIILSGLANFIPGTGALFVGGFFIGIFMLSWFYGVLFESWWNGQTPGKRVLGLRVVSVDGRPINAAQATIRNFVRVADFFPFASTQIFGSEQHMSLLPTFIIALICMVMTRRFQRLGDLAAGTMVVVDERAWYPTKVSLDDVRVASLAEFIPASFRMSSSLARTIALYVERRPAMSARRREAHAETLAKPMLQKFGFREDTSSDLLLCAIYYREFFQDSVKNEHSRKSIEGSPLSVQGPPVVPDALPEAASVLLEAST